MMKMMKKTMSSPPCSCGANGALTRGIAARPSEHVEQIKQDDDRNGDADQPEKYAAHGMSPFRQAINSL
jgi:hypothetical protein